MIPVIRTLHTSEFGIPRDGLGLIAYHRASSRANKKHFPQKSNSDLHLTYPPPTIPSTMTTATITPTAPIRFTTHSSLRRRLVLSTLTGAPLHISQIRATSLKPGLTSYEFSLLRLLDSLTNGTFIEISLTGTTLLYKPGLITGNSGRPLIHTIPENCPRGATYFLEVLALLAPFSKSAFSVTLKGGVITSATTEDYSVDTFRTALLPVYASFEVTRGIEVRTLARSSGPLGAGEVHFLHGHQVRLPRTLHLQNPGRVKRIRGVSYSTGVSAGNNARMIEAARGVLNRFIADVYVFSDVSKAQIVPADYGKEGAAEKAAGNMKGRAGGKTKKAGVGFGISLVAETSLGTMYAADAFAGPAEAAEDVGKRAAVMLLEEIRIGGVVGRHGLMSVLIMMMMGVEGDVGRVVLGKEAVGEEFIAGVRDLKRVFGGEVAVRDGESDSLVVSVVGRGVGNVGRKVA